MSDHIQSHMENLGSEAGTCPHDESATAENETVDTEMDDGQNEDGQNDDGQNDDGQNEPTTPENVLSGKKFFVLQAGNTLNVHKTIMEFLAKQIYGLKQVFTVDECDFILVFCPVVSRAGTDIDAALGKLHICSATKPAVLVVLHHTFDPECIVPESRRAVHRKNTFTVDCLFHEDLGFLQCHKNNESLTTVTELIQPPLTWPGFNLTVSEYIPSWWPWSGSAPEKQCEDEKEKDKGPSETESAGHDSSWWHLSRPTPEKNTQCEDEKEKDKSAGKSESAGHGSSWWPWSGSGLEKNTQCEDEKEKDKGPSESEFGVITLSWCPWSDSASETQNGNEEGKVQGPAGRKSGEYVVICQCQSASASQKKTHWGNEEEKDKSLTESESGELRLMLLGRRTSVQTAVKNIILGKEDRNQADTPTSSQQSENTQGEVAGRKVIVIDTPDWFSPGLCLEERLEKLKNVDYLLPSPGPHVFLLVIDVQGPTGEEISFVEEMEEILGERCWQNTMIIVTGENQEDNIQFNQEIQTLEAKCGNSFFRLNIMENSQVSKLQEEIGKRRGEEINCSDIYNHTLVQFRDLVKSISEKLEKCDDPLKSGRNNLKDEDKMKHVEQRMEMEENINAATMEEERNRIKIILPEIWKNILASNMKLHGMFSRQMEDRHITCKRPHEEGDKELNLKTMKLH